MKANLLKSRFIAVVLFLSLVLCAASAFALDDYLPKNTHMFAPTIDNSGILVTYGTDYLGSFHLAYSLYADMAISPVRYETQVNSDELTNLMPWQAGVILNFAFGFTDYVNLGFAIPMVFRSFDSLWSDKFDLADPSYVGSRYYGVDEVAFSIEDMRFDLKVMPMTRTRHCLGVGLVTTLGFPLGTTENSLASDKGFTLFPKIILDGGWKMFVGAFNLGFKYYSKKPEDKTETPPDGNGRDKLAVSDLTIGDELYFSIGGRLRFPRRHELLIDSAVYLPVEDMGNSNSQFAEVMLAYRKYWVRLNYNALTLGLSTGMFAKGPGSPMFRLFVGFGRDEARLEYMFKDATGMLY